MTLIVSVALAGCSSDGGGEQDTNSQNEQTASDGGEGAEQTDGETDEETASINIESTEWGEVTQDSIAIQSDVVVNNPLTSFQSDIGYAVSMNDIEMASGGTDQAKINESETRITMTTEIQKAVLGAWWQSHIENGEVSDVTVQASGEFSKGPFEVDEATQLNEQLKTDIIPVVEQTVQNAEGEYLSGNLEISGASADWGEISDVRSEIVITITVENNTLSPLPITDFSGIITAQEVQLFSWESDSEKIVVAPQDDEEIQVRTYLMNKRIGEWLGNHIQNNEVTDYENEVYFSVRDVDAELPLITCTGQMKTDVLVDNVRGIANNECELNPPVDLNINDEDTGGGFY